MKGATGGLAGLCFQVLRELSSGVPLSPPGAEALSSPPSPSETTSPSFLEQVHLPCLVLGLALGIFLGPLFDLAC